jgi:hypothetical protein
MNMHRPGIPSRLPFVLIVLGGLAALFGTYWDDVWHTDYGRDDLFIPPHLVLYAGVTLMGAAASLHAWLLYRRVGSVREVLSRPSLAMILLGVAATLLAAPIDEFWHVTFGRDAVVWSPPHMVGIMALFALACGVFMETLEIPGRGGVLLTLTAGAFVLGVLHVPVMEYESDVPQFAVRWYLPILAGTTALAFAIIETKVRLTWIATMAALTYLALRAIVVGFLVAMEHSAILVPPIVLPALVFDLTRRAGHTGIARAALYVAAVFAVYVPFLNLMTTGVQLSTADVAIGALIALPAVAAVLALFVPRAVRRPLATAAVLLVVLALPREAWAHDPGQGPEVGTAHFHVQQQGTRTDVFVELNTTAGLTCDEAHAIALRARRAGHTLSAPLSRIEGCRYRGQIELGDRGRWFVYAEFDHVGAPVESWIPFIHGTDGRVTRISSVYLPPQRAEEYSMVQIASGATLYLVSLLFVLSAVRAVRRNESETALTRQSSIGRAAGSMSAPSKSASLMRSGRCAAGREELCSATVDGLAG